MLKNDVLRNDKDFSIIYSKGKSLGDRYLVLFYKKNNLPYNRRAFLASKKVGNSVKRNRAKRLIRESYKEIAPFISQGYDLIFIARNTIENKKLIDVYNSMNSVLKRAKLLENKRK